MWKLTCKNNPQDKEPIEKEFSTFEELKDYLKEFDMFRKIMMENIKKGSGYNG